MRWLSGRGLFFILMTAAAGGAGVLACAGGDTIDPSTTATGGAGATGATGGGGTGGSGASGGSGGGEQVCGDGEVTPPELCDDGNSESGDGCESDCSFSCTKGTLQGDAKCDDGDPCNGAETCSDAHACVPGTQEPNGAPCGAGQVCKAGVCGDLTCGDGFVDPGEECDDGNVEPADGCDACVFDCVVDSDCDPADVCKGDGACADHLCSTENPLPAGSSCAGGGTCAGGACLVATCGNDAVEPPEQCDDGNIVGGDGCEASCLLSCEDAAVDCPAPPPCNVAVCTAEETCGTAPDPAQNGLDCGGGFLCSNGACLGEGAICGNGALEAGEDCDFGWLNGPGTGCELVCKFSCQTMPDSCLDQNACNGVEACHTVVVSGKLGKKCSPGSLLPACSTCGPGVCSGGTCVPSVCGDGCVDMAKGETCEPPSGAACDDACHTKICGNGIREMGEDCDDGNTTSLDGCSSVCHFEQIHRIRYLVIQYTTDILCSNNQLGAAVVGQTARSQLQTAIDDGVASGAIDVLFQFLDLGDLSGTADPMLQIGTMEGAPKTLAQPYDGTNDLDFWHEVSASAVDADKVPLAKVPASITAKALTAGPGSLSISVSFGAVPASLSLSGAQLAITIGAASTPLTAVGAVPPGHVPGEHLSPALTSFATAGQPNENGAGKLCGNISAASLAAVPIPEQLTTAPTACAETYKVQNSMLDLVVGGCTVFGVQQLTSTQPDQVDPAAPAAGAGAPYTLVGDAQSIITGCNDKNGAPVDLATCLNAAAYSSFFKVATGRVIAKP